MYRIGSVTGGSWEAFSNVVAASFDARGHLFLLDATERSLTEVDPRGELVRTIGRAGEGPGEYRRPLAMAVLPDGRIVVSDAGHRGLLLFGAEGEFVRSLPLAEGIFAPSILLPHGDDAVVFVSRGGMMAPGRAGSPQMPADRPIHRLEIDGEGGSEVIHRAWLPTRPDPQVSGGRDGGPTTVLRTTSAFEPQFHAAMLPEGVLAVVDSTAYRIHVVRPGHGVEGTVERPVPPVRVTDRERDLERERRLRSLREGSQTAQATAMGPGGAQTIDPAELRPIIEAQIEGMVFWPEIQVIRQLAADRDGRLWVRLFGDVDEPGPVEILGPDGTLQARIPPGAFEIPAAFGPDGLAAWIERDALDVPFVRVARLSGLP